MALALFPITIITTLIGMLMQGSIWGADIAHCTSSTCIISPFDLYQLDGITGATTSAFIVLRSGRTGTAFLAVGIYMLLRGSELLLPDQGQKNVASKDPSESYPQRNTWFPLSWSRSSLNCFIVLLMIAFLGIVYYSYTNLFGALLWYNIAGYRVATLLTEFVGEKLLENKNLVVTITTYLGVMQNLITYGASDFLNFLQSYFIELAFLIIERIYATSLVEKGLNYIERKAGKLINFVKALAGDLGQAVINESKNKSSRKKHKDNNILEDNHANLSDSNIILTDENDLTVFSLDESLDDKFDRISAVTKNYNDAKDPDSDDELEKAFKSRALIKENDNREQHRENNNDLHKDPHDLADGKKLRLTIDKVANLTPDSLITFYTPFFIGVTWVYYVQLQIGPQYSITEADYIYYWLFTIFFIPFQMVIDILSFNAIELFEGIDTFSYLQKATIRFKNRKTVWKASTAEYNLLLPEAFHEVDNWAFSSQYYFAHTIYLSGPCYMILGILMYTMNSYDPFIDGANKCIFVTFMILSFLTEKLVVYLGKKFKVWNVDTAPKSDVKVTLRQQLKITLNLNKLKSEEEEMIVRNDRDIHEIKNLEDMLDNKAYGTPRPEIRIPPIKEWSKLKEIARRDEIIRAVKADIVDGKCKLEDFKGTFLEANKHWLKSHIKEVLSPLSLKNKKMEVLQVFRQIYDKLIVTGYENLKQADDENNQAKNKMMDYAPQRKIKKAQISWQLETLIRLWKTKAVRRVQIRQKVAGLIEVMAQPSCEYCGARWNIRAECMEDIEDIFTDFIQETPNQSWAIWSDIAWQDYFKEHAVIRSICFNCDEQIILHHQKVVKRKLERRKINDIKMQGSLESIPDEGSFRNAQNLSKQGTRVSAEPRSEENSEIQTNRISPRKPKTVEKILTNWLAEVRANMNSNRGSADVSMQEIKNMSLDQFSLLNI